MRPGLDLAVGEIKRRPRLREWERDISNSTAKCRLRQVDGTEQVDGAPNSDSESKSVADTRSASADSQGQEPLDRWMIRWQRGSSPGNRHALVLAGTPTHPVWLWLWRGALHAGAAGAGTGVDSPLIWTDRAPASGDGGRADTHVTSESLNDSAPGFGSHSSSGTGARAVPMVVSARSREGPGEGPGEGRRQRGASHGGAADQTPPTPLPTPLSARLASGS